MNEITIRTLSKQDVNGAALIRVEGWKQAYKGIIDNDYLNSLDIKKQITKFEQCIGNPNFIVAIINNKVVGFCRFIDNNSFSSNINYVDCELSAIYVHPDYKRKGIGSKMFNYAKNEFYKKNKKTMIIWCLQDNIKSIEFYKHMGGVIKESKLALIGDKEYKEIGIIFNI